MQATKKTLPEFAKDKKAKYSDISSLLAALGQEPALMASYKRARLFRDITRNASNYDIASRCNLLCEGCFYFEGQEQSALKENNDLAAWEDFFAAQAENRVGYGYFAGAEPALAQDRLAVAAKYIARGSISTNGTIKIDSALPYAILVSIWGDETETEKFRGGGTFWKSIRNYAGDPRARFIYTVNRHNITSIDKVAHILHSEGARFSFNYYSPTTSYLQKIQQSAGNDKAFFRLSNAGYQMHFASEDLPGVYEAINRIIDTYPKACLHTKELNGWLTIRGERYKIDAVTGVAVNCSGRNTKWHQAYGVDLNPSPAKCCTPNVECSECRLYSPALNSLLFQHEKFSENVDSFRAWLAICDQWGRLFLTDDDKAWMQ